VERDAELLRGIATEVLLDERRSETIKAAATAVWVVKRFPAAWRPGRRQRAVHFLHESAGALQHGERRVAYFK